MSNTLIDLTGQKFGRLTVLSKAKPYKTKGGKYITKWVCQCECGNIVEVDTQKLRKNHTNSCGCLKKENKGRPKSNISQINKRFGKLTVVKRLSMEERVHKPNDLLCLCDCGKTIQTNAYKLLTGHSKSCGCMKAERIGNLNKKYQYTNKRLYSVYKAMIDRCCDSKNPMYKHYGEKGIVVCEEWLNDYDAFAKWAFESGYDKDAKFQQCTLDRRDNNGIYEPSNCRWITNKQQAQNTSRCRYFEHNGEVHNIAEWAEILGINYKTMYRDLINRNLTVQQVIRKRLCTIY